MSPFAQSLTCAALIAWSIIGTQMVLELYESTLPVKWKAFLIGFGGPCVWGCAAYRWLTIVHD